MLSVVCFRYAQENGDVQVLESMKDYLISMIQRTFEVSIEQSECLYSELLQCTRKKNLVSITSCWPIRGITIKLKFNNQYNDNNEFN